MVAKPDNEPPFEGGAQRTPEHRAELPKTRGNVTQTIVVVVSLLVIIAAIVWILVPFGN